MAPDQLPAGQVTIADLYRELTGMRTDIGKALTRLEVIDARDQAAAEVDRDHEGRLRALEAFRWKLVGIALCISVAAGLLSGYLTYVIETHR